MAKNDWRFFSQIDAFIREAESRLEKLRILRDQVAEIEKVNGTATVDRLRLNLRPSARAVLGLLLKRQEVTVEAMYSALYQDRADGDVADISTVDAYLHQIRGELRQHNINLGLISAMERGKARYFILSEDKKKILAMIPETEAG